MLFFLLSYIVGLSAIVTKNAISIAILALLLMKNQQKVCWAIAGLLCALILFSVLWSKNHKTVRIECNNSFCYLMILPLKEQNLKISNTPDQFMKTFEGQLHLERSSSFLPLTSQKILKITKQIGTEVLRKNYLFTQAIEQGLASSKSLDKIFLEAGWAHYFCLSGWHAQYLYRLSNKNSYLFFLVSIIASYCLNFPFPFLRSTAHILLKCPVKALAVILCFQPFAPLTMTFWLTMYYQFLLNYTQISQASFLLSSLCLCQLFSGHINIIIFLFFQTIGNKLAPYMISSIILLKPVQYFYPNIITALDQSLESWAQKALYYSSYRISLPEEGAIMILLLLMLNLKYRPIRRKGSRYS